MDPQSFPLEISCLGCKRYFLFAQKLPLQSMTVEFKNYSFPIKESFLKENLLKTIVGFMNSKGGTIFMGVNDSNGSVQGVRLGRKQMDEFKLMIKQMLQKVQPTVDLIKSEEVSVDFIPVLEGKERSFFGKYVVKFIVLQGDPSKLYCLSERVKVSGAKYQEVEIISAFRRHNLGGIQEIKGIKVIHQIYQKARNPHKVAKTFHQSCNPPPLCPILSEKQKFEKSQKIFADEEGGEKGNTSSQSNSSSEHSDKQTIIDIIKNSEKQVGTQKRSLIKVEEPICIYLKNIRPDAIKSFINFLKNSTVAKNSKQICGLNEVVRIRFSLQSEKECFIEQLSKPSMKRLADGFGNKGKVQILHSLGHTPTPKDSSNSNRSQKTEDKAYTLIFHGFQTGNEGSIQNYLQKCLTSNIERKMKRTGQGIEIEFKSRKDMYVFESMCKKPPHSVQLDRFWPKCKALIRISVREQNEKNGKTSENKMKQTVKIEAEGFPSLLQQSMVVQSSNEQKSVELVASSLDPTQVPKLSNYFTNNMFYNIQKKLFLSKQKYYMRLVFTQTQDCKKFLQYCHTEQHKNLLSQFVSSKTLRIGFPGDSLLIFPYTDQLKEQIKKMVLKVLGQGVIKSSAVKLISNETKVWSLNFVDNSKLLEGYQKLESYLRKSPLFFNQEWVLFKVYLDYKELKQ